MSRRSSSPLPAVSRLLVELGQNIRNDEQACIIMPRVYDEGGHELYGFKLVSAAGTRQFYIGKWVVR